MTVIALLILAGIILLILEFFVFPGITVSGAAGVIMIGSGIWIAYSGYGTSTGNSVLISSIVALIVVFIISLRSKTWKKLMLNTELTGNFESVTEGTISPGDRGITVTRLNPTGKAIINDEEVEARCPGEFLDPQTEIEAVKVFKTYIIVKPVIN
ncbi:NfeD family protein [Marinilabiliaceae bacterium ANBcel2]|nr:NfeD family protein [Marinilabiliaceae bacterium ANBcel2]